MNILRQIHYWWKTKNDPRYRQREAIAKGKVLWEQVTRSSLPMVPATPDVLKLINSRLKSLSKEEKELLKIYLNRRNSNIYLIKPIKNGETIWRYLESYFNELDVTEGDEVRFSFLERKLKEMSIADKSDLLIWLSNRIYKIERNFDEFATARVEQMEAKEKQFYQRHIDLIQKSLNEDLK